MTAIAPSSRKGMSRPAATRRRVRRWRFTSPVGGGALAAARTGRGRWTKGSGGASIGGSGWPLKEGRVAGRTSKGLRAAMIARRSASISWTEP